MTDNPAIIDRKRGCLYGLAIGDALGAPVEFKEPGMFPPVTGYRDGGPWGLKAGEWTDDTSMALALATTLARGFDLNNQASEYWAWYAFGKHSCIGRCFDIGGNTLGALTRWHDGEEAGHCGHRHAGGNGCIMRLAPLAIRYASEPAMAGYAIESTLVTHGHPEALASAVALSVILGKLILTGDREAALDSADLLEVVGRNTMNAPITTAVVAGSYLTRNPPTIRGGGFAPICLEAALWAFHNARDFYEAVTRAVNLGGDADTTGAVCGQLAGAYWGEQGLTAKLYRGLARKDLIEKALKGIL